MSDKRTVRTIENTFIPMPDGARLAARIWLPDDAERNPVPAILEYIPYRKRDFMRLRDEPMHAFYAAHGYAAVRVDLRGSGDSDGVLADEYLPAEQADAVAVIHWLAAQPWCDGKVGMTGISWGGFSALQAAAHAPEPLQAVIALCASDDRYADDAHYMGGCLLNENQIWGTVLFAINALPADPDLVGETWRAGWHQRLEADRPFPALWLSHPRRDGYWQQGSVCEHPERIRCAVYAVGGWADGYSNAVPRLLEALPGPRRGLVGPWAHTFPHNGVPGPAIGFLNEALRWWDRWLKDRDTGIDGEPMYRAWMQEAVPPGPNVTERPGRWICEAAWPSARIEPRRLWLQQSGRLVAEPPADPGWLDVCSPVTTGLAGAVWCEFGAEGESPLDQRMDDGGSLVFDSAPLTTTVEVLGAMQLEVEIVSDRPHALLAARVNDVSPQGASQRVSLGILNLCHRDSMETPAPLVPGQRYRVTVACNDIAHRFAPGHRIRVAISTAYWPMVWPSRTLATISVATGTSTLLLPVRAPAAADDRLLPFADPDGDPPTSTIKELGPARLERSITRDLTSNEVVYRHCSVGGDLDVAAAVRIEDIDLVLAHTTDREFRILESDPLSACTTVTERMALGRGGWRVRIEAQTSTSADLEAFRVTACLRAYENDRLVFERDWDERLPRDCL